MESMLRLIKDNSVNLIIGLTVFDFFVIVLFIVNRIKVNKLIKKYNNFMSGLSPAAGMNIEDTLIANIQRINDMKDENVRIIEELDKLKYKIQFTIQKIGIVRYSAFEDVGSDLSFSLAILDSKDNGIILTGIYSRESSSTYCKPIIEGDSKYTLSAEELQAYEKAKKEYVQRQKRAVSV